MKRENERGGMVSRVAYDFVFEVPAECIEEESMTIGTVVTTDRFVVSDSNQTYLQPVEGNSATIR
jgi:hypothetical protein